MKKLFVFTFLLCVTLQANAQFDTNSGSISVPKGNTTSTDTPSLSTTSPFTLTPPKPTVSNPYQVGANNESNFSMYQKDEFVSRSSEYMDRVQVKTRESESNEPYKGNIDFGVIKTKSPYIILMARDFGAEDGDRVKVTVNNKIIVANVTLTNRGAAIMITLAEGFNNIQIEALNQGTSGPNTGDFGVKDNEEKLLARNEWNLATGFYAKFIVVKE